MINVLIDLVIGNISCTSELRKSIQIKEIICCSYGSRVKLVEEVNMMALSTFIELSSLCISYTYVGVFIAYIRTYVSIFTYTAHTNAYV